MPGSPPPLPRTALHCGRLPVPYLSPSTVPALTDGDRATYSLCSAPDASRRPVGHGTELPASRPAHCTLHLHIILTSSLPYLTLPCSASSSSASTSWLHNEPLTPHPPPPPPLRQFPKHHPLTVATVGRAAVSRATDMDLHTTSNSSLPWVSDPVAQGVQTTVHIVYPILLLCLYLTAFTARSIYTARNDNDTQPPPTIGPLGKPLPKKNQNSPPSEQVIPQELDFSKPRKLLFEWMSVGVIFSLLGNVVVVIVHALYARKERWWCGQATTVGGIAGKSLG